MSKPPLEELMRTFPFEEGEHYAVEGGCWLWLGYVDPQGYGRCQIERLKRPAGTARAHRVGWAHLHGTRLHPSVDLHHRCENKRCVNPDHLEALARGAHQRLHVHEGSVLTEADVVAMREERQAGASLPDLAEKYGTTYSNVGYICRGKSWATSPGPIERTLECRQCGTNFTPYGSIDRYCSKSCRLKHWNESRKVAA